MEWINTKRKKWNEYIYTKIKKTSLMNWSAKVCKVFLARISINRWGEGSWWISSWFVPWAWWSTLQTLHPFLTSNSVLTYKYTPHDIVVTYEAGLWWERLSVIQFQRVGSLDKDHAGQQKSEHHIPRQLHTFSTCKHEFRGQRFFLRRRLLDSFG